MFHLERVELPSRCLWRVAPVQGCPWSRLAACVKCAESVQLRPHRSAFFRGKGGCDPLLGGERQISRGGGRGGRAFSRLDIVSEACPGREKHERDVLEYAGTGREDRQRIRTDYFVFHSRLRLIMCIL